LDTVVFTDPKAIEFFTNEMLLVKIDCDVDTLTKQHYRVSGYPTTVLIDKNGEDVDRVIGFRPAEEYMQTLVDYSNGIGTLADLLQQAETKEDREMYYEIANKYKYSGGSREAEVWFARVVEAGEPTDSLSGMSRLGAADMFRRARDYDRSLEAFKEMAVDFQGTDFEEVADIYTAIVYKRMEDTTAAVTAFQKFIDKYPESEDVEYATEQIESLLNPTEEAGQS
jgi:tetratricopeptide (TPR) repeat protein